MRRCPKCRGNAGRRKNPADAGNAKLCGSFASQKVHHVANGEVATHQSCLRRMKIAFAVCKKGLEHEQFQLFQRIAHRKHLVEHLVELLLCYDRAARGKFETELLKALLMKGMAHNFQRMTGLAEAHCKCEIGLNVARTANRANRNFHRRQR